MIALVMHSFDHTSYSCANTIATKYKCAQRILLDTQYLLCLVKIALKATYSNLLIICRI